jgi:hypothetical protein
MKKITTAREVASIFSVLPGLKKSTHVWNTLKSPAIQSCHFNDCRPVRPGFSRWSKSLYLEARENSYLPCDRSRSAGARATKRSQAYIFGMLKLSPDVWRKLKASMDEMETMVAGMRELRHYMTTKGGLDALDETIKQAEKQLSELRRMVVN